MTETLYDQDFFAWANEQAQLLRAGKLADADIQHIAEEIESMGKAEKRELISRLSVLLLHLLKWQFQAERRGASWEATITVQRDDLADHLSDNPSLRGNLSEAVESAYRKAAILAHGETNLPRQSFPAHCPWTVKQILGGDFWPGEARA
jgi:Domain of unknown function DUF29